MVSSATNLTLADPFTKGLACAAIHPGLRSILVFDAPYIGLKTAAAVLAQMLECSTGQKVQLANLGVSELDDDLWGSLVLSNDSGDSPVVWHHGTLAGLWEDSDLRLVIIPDLAQLSLAAARACVMLVCTDVAHLERHGQHETWQPNICWLASCARDEVGRVSPHLLDRFALRLNWQSDNPTNKVVDLLEQLQEKRFPEDTNAISIPPAMKVRIQWARQHWASLTEAMVTTVLDYISKKVKICLSRREIALARLAQAIALVDGESLVTASHIDAAVDLIKLIDSEKDVEATPQPHTNFLSSSASPLQSSSTPSIEGSKNFSFQPQNNDITASIYDPNEDRILTEAALPLSPSTNPYPEDTAPVEREFTSLRLPLPHHTVSRIGRGTIIGVEHANTLHDLALVSTLFAAAPFQPIRRKYRPVDNRRLLLSAADLRSYRRSPIAEQMLLLLLDYTSLDKCDWIQALSPYLHWAYVERASVCIVQVGMADAAHELCAERVSARSILVPSIELALEAKPGKATPLAHGLDLAFQALRHALEHGRSTVEQVLLVVISDGRGNVPLAASHAGYIGKPVSREGIEDALQIAQQIRDQKGMQAVLLNPQPEYYSDLPLTLAKMLNAGTVDIERLGVEEV